METINDKVANNRIELKRLQKERQKYHKEIVNNFLLIELLMIYFNTLTFKLNNQIKSPLILDYLMSAKSTFNQEFELIENKKTILKVMNSNKNYQFKKALSEETEFIQTLVRNLNKVFVIQYDRYSWSTFKDFYIVNHENVKTINKNINLILNQAKTMNPDLVNDYVEKNALEKVSFLPLEEKNSLMVPLILYLSRK